MTFPVGTTPRLWPVDPNWRESVQEDWSFRTEIATSRNGTEQRRALRVTPRRRISQLHTLDGAARRRIHGAMASWQNRPFIFADPLRGERLTAATTSGATVLHFAALPAWLIAGATVVVGFAEARVVASISTGAKTATLSAGLNAAWNVGTMVRPSSVGLITGQPTVNQVTATVAETHVTFQVDPGSEILSGGAPGFEITSGFEVLGHRANWAESIDDTIDWVPEQVDFGFGRIDNNLITTYANVDRRLVYVLDGTVHSQDYREFVLRRCGRRGEFIVPSWQADLDLVVAIAADATTLTFAGTDAAADYADHPVYQHLCISRRDGLRAYRRILSWATSGGNSIATIDRPIYEALTLADVQVVCWAPLSRFASDDFAFEWKTPSVAVTAAAFHALPWRPAEAFAADYDGADDAALEMLGDTPDFDRFDYLVNARYGEVTT